VPTQRINAWRGSTGPAWSTARRSRGSRSAAGEIDVEAGGKSYRCRRLAIAAGPWSNLALANFGIELPLEVTQEQVTYFASPRWREFMPDRFPVWIWMDDPCYYGFPVFGEDGPKAAQDAAGKPVTADSPDMLSRTRTIPVGCAIS
jgi:sarcosine oxidase